MRTNRLIDFYKVNPVDYWIYKLCLLKNTRDNYDSVKDVLHKDLIDVDDEDYIKMLNVEIHFTYFQIIETLFEMIFALEDQDDINLWYDLTFSNWRQNYKRIQEIADRKVSFLDKEIELDNGDKISLLQYIFYFVYPTKISESEMRDNLKIIKKALILFAKDFSDRDDYNAYKHSMRLFHSATRLAIAPTGSSNFQPIAYAKDSLIYLGKDDQGQLREITKGFDPDRDFRMGALCYQLISNIIVTRRMVFHKTKETIYLFHNIDLITESTPSTTSLIKWSFTI